MPALEPCGAVDPSVEWRDVAKLSCCQRQLLKLLRMAHAEHDAAQLRRILYLPPFSVDDPEPFT